MIKQFLFLGLAGGLTLATSAARAQTPATLTGSSYTENFDNLSAGLPTGFSVYTGTSTSLGTVPTAAQLLLTPGSNTTWASTTGGFKNFASADALPSGATTAQQTAATDRSLGVRQTGTLGDPGAAFVFQAANTSGKTDFTLTFKLQSLDASSTRIATWQVDYGTGSTPSTFTKVGTAATTGNSTFANNTVTVNFGTALDDQAGPVYIRIATLGATTGSGNRPSSAIDDFQLNWNTPNASTPVLTASASALAFGSQNINTSSASQQYTLSGANLSTATTVTATGPFTVSKDNSTFSASVTYTPAELAAATPVYVRFAPTATGAATGSISNASAGATPRTVTLTGTGSNPNQTLFDFSTCVSTLSDGWSQYSVNGAQMWACTTFGRDPAAPAGTTAAPYGVQMNGYSAGNIENEDWFISPSFDLTTYTYPLFSFWSRTAFTGPALKLRVSTNYSGTGAPSAATWTDVNVLFPGVGTDVWTQTANVNLAAFKGQKVYVAFVYTSTSSAAARWTLDDIALTNSPTPPSPTILTDAKSLAFGYTATGTNGDRTLNVSGNDLTGPVTLTSSDPLFTLSKDGVNFSSTLTLTAAEANATTKAVTVRFRPTTAFATFTGTISVSTAGAAAPLSVTLSGDTYDTSKTLEVVNWNIEWFGSTEAGLGPNDKNLQQTNVSTVFNYLKADVYALAEVVDTVRLANVVTQLSATTGYPYAWAVSRYGSYGDSPKDPDYAGDQKLAFVYRTDVVKNATFMGLLRCTEVQNCPAYNAWAGGRFPFLMSADVTLDGVTKHVNIVEIHAKANATTTSPNDYARRKLGADLLKAYLDTNFPNDNNLIVGDYNDVLNGTIATGITPPVSSYSSFLNDANYVPISLPLAQAGLQSTASFATVIDNVIANKPLASYYINGTAAVRTDVTTLVTNYATTTSDHYPIFTRYSFSAPDLVVSTANQVVAGGNYNSIMVMGTGSGTLQGPVQVNTSVTVQSGARLDTNCQPLTGTGSFTVADGGTLGICDAAGITATGSTGAIQVTGTRSFSTAASYVYNGTTTQVTGLGLPTQVRDLTTTNAASLTLSQPLTIAQTLTVASSGNVVLNNQALTLLSSATGTALVVNSGTGTVQGATATAQRYLDGSRNPGPGYRQLSAPVSGSTVADLSTPSFTPVVNPAYNTSPTPNAVQPFPTVYGYDEARLALTNNLSTFDKGFFSPASLSDPLVVAKGYTVNLAANQVVDFVGMLNNGDYPQSLARQNQTTDGGWQLLGNPYPAPLDWSLVAPADRAGLNGAVYVSQSTGQYATQYRSYVNGVGNPILPLAQGFFVQVAQGQTTATLTLRNSQRVTNYATQVSVQRLTAETRPRLNLTLGTAAGLLDGLYVYAEADATTGFDAKQDAAKLLNNNGLNLAALASDGQPLSIQAFSTFAGRVALRVQVPAAGTYTLAAAELLNLPAGAQPVLEDAQTGQRTPLTAAGSAYTFTVAAGEPIDGRFWLNLNGTASPLATTGALQAALTVYPNPTHDGLATLLVPTGTAAGQVQVLDALGRLVRQQSLSAGNTTALKLTGLPAGVYVLRVQAGSQQATRRLTIN